MKKLNVQGTTFDVGSMLIKYKYHLNHEIKDHDHETTHNPQQQYGSIKMPLKGILEITN